MTALVYSAFSIGVGVVFVCLGFTLSDEDVRGIVRHYKSADTGRLLLIGTGIVAIVAGLYGLSAGDIGPHGRQ